MINKTNYYDRIKVIDWNAVPASLKKIHETLIPDAAKSDWSAYSNDGDVKRVVDKYFGYIAKFVPASNVDTPVSKKAAVLPKQAKQASAPKEKKQKIAKVIPELPEPKQVVYIPTATSFIKRYAALHGKIKTKDQILSLTHGLQKAITEQRIKSGDPAMREIEKMQSELIMLATTMGDSAKIEIDARSLTHYKQIAQGEEIRTSVKLLKQFIQINGKAPDKVKAEKLGRKMAEAYVEIPKEDPYRSELSAGTDALADYCNGNTKTVGIPEVSLRGLSGLAGIGAFAGLGRAANASPILQALQDARVNNLSEASMKRAFAKSPAPGLCLEIAKLLIRRGSLNMSVVRGQSLKPITTYRTELSGMSLDAESPGDDGINATDLLNMRLSGSGHSSISGLGNVVESGVINKTESFTQQINRPAHSPLQIGSESLMEKITARDLAKMRFKTIGYNGRYKDVIGDPAIGFRMMVYAKPFEGKSSFAIEFCKDLAELGKGRIAYLALEEGISASMKKKVVDRGAANVDGLDFLGYMPASFAGYNFVVIDSVSDRSMKREALRELFSQNPDICFICIFHATKEGTARGGLDYSHDMDIILKIENHKPVVEKNRFL